MPFTLTGRGDGPRDSSAFPRLRGTVEAKDASDGPVDRIGSGFELIPESLDGEKKLGLARVALELLPEPGHVDVYSSGER